MKDPQNVNDFDKLFFVVFVDLGVAYDMPFVDMLNLKIVRKMPDLKYSIIKGKLSTIGLIFARTASNNAQ